MQTFEIDKPYNQQQFKNFLYDFLPDDFEEDNQELFYDNFNSKIIRLRTVTRCFQIEKQVEIL